MDKKAQFIHLINQYALLCSIIFESAKNIVFVPESLKVLKILIHLIITNLWGRKYYLVSFKLREINTQII